MLTTLLDVLGLLALWWLVRSGEVTTIQATIAGGWLQVAIAAAWVDGQSALRKRVLRAGFVIRESGHVARVRDIEGEDRAPTT